MSFLKYLFKPSLRRIAKKTLHPEYKFWLDLADIRLEVSENVIAHLNVGERSRTIYLSPNKGLADGNYLSVHSAAIAFHQQQLTPQLVAFFVESLQIVSQDAVALSIEYVQKKEDILESGILISDPFSQVRAGIQGRHLAYQRLGARIIEYFSSLTAKKISASSYVIKDMKELAGSTASSLELIASAAQSTVSRLDNAESSIASYCSVFDIPKPNHEEHINQIIKNLKPLPIRISSLAKYDSKTN